MKQKIIRWLRQLMAWFGGKEKQWEEHYLFHLPILLPPEEIAEKLWKHGWGYNTLSTRFHKEILTLRKLDPPRHQYHLRFYSDGAVTGHYEVDCIFFPLEHLDGVDLRPFTSGEKEEIRRILTGCLDCLYP